MVFNYCIVPLTFNVIGLSELNADPDLLAMKMMTIVMTIMLLLPNQLFAREFLVITEMVSTRKAIATNVSVDVLEELILKHAVVLGLFSTQLKINVIGLGMSMDVDFFYYFWKKLFVISDLKNLTEKVLYLYHNSEIHLISYSTLLYSKVLFRTLEYTF